MIQRGEPLLGEYSHHDCSSAHFCDADATSLVGVFKLIPVPHSLPTEYHLLRCNRKSTVSHTFRFSDVRACVLTVDNGPCHSRLNGARNAQPHVGREPAGYISLLDASGEYHNVFGGYGMLDLRSFQYIMNYIAFPCWPMHQFLAGRWRALCVESMC